MPVLATPSERDRFPIVSAIRVRGFRRQVRCRPASYSKFDFNPAAFTLPQGLTFGDAGRSDARNPNRINFDMGIFKHFAIKESTALEFRAEAFNIFNHPQFYIASSSGTGQTVGMSCLMAAGGTAGDCTGPGGSSFGQISSAHLARVMQFSLKFLF